MSGSWKINIGFWTALFVSCACLVLVVAIGVVTVRSFFTGGPPLSDLEPAEILNLLILGCLPFIILFLIVRAIRFRGRPLLAITRALSPLILVALFVGFVFVRQYFDIRSEMWTSARWTEGSITHICSTLSSSVDYDPLTIGPIDLKLVEQRHPGELSTWIVMWPSKAPIQAESFEAHTGSIGGSQGIRWREPDGTRRVAHLSFSDLMGEYGPSSIWMYVMKSDASAKPTYPNAASSERITCGPDPSSYRR